MPGDLVLDSIHFMGDVINVHNYKDNYVIWNYDNNYNYEIITSNYVTSLRLAGYTVLRLSSVLLESQC